MNHSQRHIKNFVKRGEIRYENKRSVDEAPFARVDNWIVWCNSRCAKRIRLSQKLDFTSLSGLLNEDILFQV